MKRIHKSLMAYYLIKFLHLSDLIRRLYRLAMDVKFEKISQAQLLEIMDLIRANKKEKYPLVRLGSINDGGYVVVDDISRQDVLISLGIGNNSDFEYQISSKIQRIIAFDHTINEMPVTADNIQFNKLGVKAKSAGRFTTLSSVIESIPVQNDLLLKIDIEGWEWEVLNSISDAEISRFRQIIGEFHDFHDAAKTETINQVLSKIVRYFDVINTHANNWGQYDIIKRLAIPDVIEITFMRKDRSKQDIYNSLGQSQKLNSKNNWSDLDLGFNLL